MKTKYGIILLLIGIVACSFETFAADYTYKVTVTRTENRSIVPDNSANCDGSVPTLPTINYSVTMIDSNFTQFSIRIVKKSDLSAYYSTGLSNLTVTHGGNFNLATGELTHTITGIPKINETLIIRFYKNGGATGSPYAEQELTIATDTRAKAGYVTFGNVGNGDIFANGGDNSGNPGSISSYGGFVTSASISNSAQASEITVNFTALDDANYVAMVSVTSGDPYNSNNIMVPVVYNKTSGSFKILMEDNAYPTTVESIRLDLILQAY